MMLLSLTLLCSILFLTLHFLPFDHDFWQGLLSYLSIYQPVPLLTQCLFYCYLFIINWSASSLTLYWHSCCHASKHLRKTVVFSKLFSHVLWFVGGIGISLPSVTKISVIMSDFLLCFRTHHKTLMLQCFAKLYNILLDNFGQIQAFH